MNIFLLQSYEQIKAPPVKDGWGKNVSPAVCIANVNFRTVKCGQFKCLLNFLTV